MIQILVDGVLVYDSSLEEYSLQALKTTRTLNKGGTAEIVLPPGHPAYSRFIAYKSIVEIYRDDRLTFRGRPLYVTDDFYNCRTVMCEGEFCFLQDAVSRPYLYQTTPKDIFTALLGVYNGQVEAAKRFRVGTITVTDDNEYVRLESESAETVLDTLNKLVERCGGYVVFTTATDGARVINWYESIGYRSSQVIEFGANLLSFSRSGANTSLATAILPYGAKDEETGEVLTIASVNNGVDYIQDDEAVALRGFICRAVTWDDVTKPQNLLRKAQKYLATSRLIITSLDLTALDLSYLDKDIDTFREGDVIRVKSKPHNVDEDFLLMSITEDLLNPANSSIALGKDKNTLTEADVAGDNYNRDALHKTIHRVRADYTLGIANAIRETERVLSSLIEQTSELIKLEVSETYSTPDQVVSSVSTTLSQFSDQFLFEFESLRATVDENNTDASLQFTEIYRYIQMKDGKLILGTNEKDAMTLTLDNGLIEFSKNGAIFGWWDGVDFHTGNIVVEVNERAQFGDFAFVPRSNGSLSFLKVGG